MSRIDGFLDRSASLAAADESSSEVTLATDFTAAMNDDLGTPTALAVLFRTVKEGNVALESGEAETARRARRSVLLMLQVFGLDPPPQVVGRLVER